MIKRVYETYADLGEIDLATRTWKGCGCVVSAHPRWLIGLTPICHVPPKPVKPAAVLPSDAAQRKNVPLARGLLDYFPRALCAVAELSRIGNEQHNPGKPMHWARAKSTDHADCLMRHMIDRGTLDIDGVRHSAKVAWRALAMLELELDAAVKNV